MTSSHLSTVRTAVCIYALHSKKWSLLIQNFIDLQVINYIHNCTFPDIKVQFNYAKYWTDIYCTEVEFSVKITISKIADLFISAIEFHADLISWHWPTNRLWHLTQHASCRLLKATNIVTLHTKQHRLHIRLHARYANFTNILICFVFSNDVDVR